MAVFSLSFVKLSWGSPVTWYDQIRSVLDSSWWFHSLLHIWDFEYTPFDLPTYDYSNHQYCYYNQIGISYHYLFINFSLAMGTLRNMKIDIAWCLLMYSPCRNCRIYIQLQLRYYILMEVPSPFQSYTPCFDHIVVVQVWEKYSRNAL